ncbi:MAG: MiaB/RimO family radical SAM methylthiotransferase [Alphaproteobacteria bacterium]|nr:MiaB/RimO family radical SAM methylthiotransferase [Alphaproteobacteria bacterium]
MVKMQAENNKNNIKTLSFGCRLNAMECEKIKNMLCACGICAVVVNTCAVTAEAERQCGQAVRKIARENPNTIIFVTGCAATRNPKLFEKISGVVIVPNEKKMDLDTYMSKIPPKICGNLQPGIRGNFDLENKLSKQFVQIQNGCNHDCTYCVTRLLRGPAISFEYDKILENVRSATENGFGEIVLTGVDIASYVRVHDGRPFLISDLCQQLLDDVPNLQRLRLSSVDPAVPAICDIIEMMKKEPRFMPHLHLSMQSGSDVILHMMRRRHTADKIRDLVRLANGKISFSWDIICGFPGETDELFGETLNLAQELKPIRIHAFPFSPRPGTVAAEMPNQIPRDIAKARVRKITDIANKNMCNFMKNLVGNTFQVLVESDNVGRTPDDIPVQIIGTDIPPRTICNVKITDANETLLIGNKI